MKPSNDTRQLLWSMPTLLFLLSGCGGGGGGYGDDPPPPSPAQPTVSLQPPGGASVNRTITLKADATAAAGITRVEFLVDGTVAGNDTTAPFEFAWDTSVVPDGAHRLATRITDAANRTVTSADVTVTVKNLITINVTLSPDEIFPRPQSTANGTGELTFNLINGAVTSAVTTVGFEPTNAHIHGGYAGTNGAPVVQFNVNANNRQRWDAPAGSMLTAQGIEDLLAGKLYVNVHSAQFQNGEIRAQIQPENIKVVFTALNGNAVVPPVVTTANALAATTIDTLRRTATIHVNTSLGAEQATAVHVHKGAATANVAEAFITLAQDNTAPAHWSAATQPISAADVDAFTTNGWYIDLHAQNNPGGLLRGQILATRVSLGELQTSIFTPRCSGCHSGTAPVGTLPAGMNLTSVDASRAALVGQPSVQQPNVLRVSPGRPEESYLVRKLEGAAGIGGGRMPQGGPFLDQATIDKVKTWILGLSAPTPAPAQEPQPQPQPDPQPLPEPDPPSGY